MPERRKNPHFCWQTVPHVDDTDSKVRRSNTIAAMSPIQLIGMTSGLSCMAKLKELWYTNTDTLKYNAVTRIQVKV